MFGGLWFNHLTESHDIGVKGSKREWIYCFEKAAVSDCFHPKIFGLQ